MGEKYFPSKYTGVRYREHASRRNGIRKDRYFMIRYKFDGKTKNEGFGWESQGYTELKAFEAVCAIKQNIKNGTGYKSLKEKYELANQERKAKEAEEAAEKERNITFSELWDNIYEPIYLSKKIQKTQVNEKSLYKKYIFPKIGALKIYEIIFLVLSLFSFRLYKASSCVAAPKASSFLLVSSAILTSLNFG